MGCAAEPSLFFSVKQSLDIIFAHCSFGSFRVREPDAGGNNLKYVAHEEAKLNNEMQGYDCLPCGLHQQNLVVQRAMSPQCSMMLVKVAHSLACLLQGGDYFTRLVLSVPALVAKKLVVVRRPPGAKQRLMQRLFLDIFFKGGCWMQRRSQASVC